MKNQLFNVTQKNIFGKLLPSVTMLTIIDVSSIGWN